MRFSAQVDRLPEDARIAVEAAVPEGVTDDEYRGCGLVLPLGEPPAKLWVDAQHAGHGCRHPDAFDALGAGCAGHGQTGFRVGTDGRKRSGTRRKIEVVRRGEDVRLAVGRDGVAGPEPDQAVRVGKRERAQQDAAYQAEDGRVRGDPQGEGQGGDSGESGFAGENAARVHEVLTERVHGGGGARARPTIAAGFNEFGGGTEPSRVRWWDGVYDREAGLRSDVPSRGGKAL